MTILVSSSSVLESTAFLRERGLRGRHLPNAAAVSAPGKVAAVHLLPSHHRRPNRHAINAAIRLKRARRQIVDLIDETDWTWQRRERSHQPMLDFSEPMLPSPPPAPREVVNETSEPIVVEGPPAVVESAPIATDDPFADFDSAPDDADEPQPETDRPALIARAKALGIRVTNQKNERILEQILEAESKVDF